MLAQEHYHDNGEMPSGRRSQPERRPVSTRSVIDAAKEQVATIDLADRLCRPGRLRRRGVEWVGRCPLPDHDEKTPSFQVNPDKDVWHCFGCARGGDVIELARFAWGYDRGEVAMAAADLLREFGHDVPTRPPSWFRKQERQKPARDALSRAKVEHAQRRVYRILLPLVDEIEDPSEKRDEAEYLWDSARQVAALLVGGRRS